VTAINIEPSGSSAIQIADRQPPPGLWVMQQRWHDLLFAHWRVKPESIQRLLPADIEVDTYRDDAWVSVIPFYMTGVRFRALPPIPTANSFAELNVRTYVRCGGDPGIWFFSLDAASTLAVVGARLGAALPYFRAAMTVGPGSRAIDYRSERLGIVERPAIFDATYYPGARCVEAAPGSLDFFLAERYTLFSADGAGTWRIDIHHPRWKLQTAHAAIRRNTMLDAAGVTTGCGQPLLRFAAFQDVRFWPPKRVV
jgi:uncharacterized protein